MGAPKLPNAAGFGQTLRSLRLKRGMTMGDMARALAVTVPVVSDIELGRGGSRDLADRFVQVLREHGLDVKSALIFNACAALVWPDAGEAKR
jgi:transcriptional regulator with XRE-family HTH domain